MGCVRKSCMRPSHRRSGPEPPRRLQLSLRARTPHCRHAYVARCYTFTLFLLLTLCLIVLLRCIDPSSLPSPTAERREFFARPGLGAAACCARRVFAAAACGRGFGAGRGRLLDGELPLPNRIVESLFGPSPDVLLLVPREGELLLETRLFLLGERYELGELSFCGSFGTIAPHADWALVL